MLEMKIIYIYIGLEFFLKRLKDALCKCFLQKGTSN